jgi:CBS domain-containing protein
MRIKDHTTLKTKPKPYTFLPQAMVQEAIDVMCEKKIGSVIVTNADNTVAGIVTEKELVTRVLKEKLDPSSTPLSEIMRKNIPLALETDNLVNWMRTMSEKRFRHLPIVDDRNRLINMMSQGDLLVYTWPDLYEKVRMDIKGRLGRWFQILLVGFAIITLGLIAMKM